MAYYTHGYSPAYQEPDRRGRAQLEVTRGYTRRSRMKWLTFLYGPSLLGYSDWGNPVYVGVPSKISLLIMIFDCYVTIGLGVTVH